MQTKLKNKLLIWFAGFSIFAFILFILFNYLYYQRKNNVTLLNAEFNQIYNGILKDFDAANNIVNMQLSDTNFYITKRNFDLNNFRKKSGRLINKLSDIRLSAENRNIPITQEIDKILIAYKDYNNSIDQVIKLQLQKGIGKYGILGEIVFKEGFK